MSYIIFFKIIIYVTIVILQKNFTFYNHKYNFKKINGYLEHNMNIK